MEFWEKGVVSSETWRGEENEDDGGPGEKVKAQEKGSAARRFYECIYCRRGFTNAQALGGHMNIHRKDRAKAKHPFATNSSPPTTTIKLDSDDDDNNYDQREEYAANHRRTQPSYFLPPPDYSNVPRYGPPAPNLSIQIAPTYGEDTRIERQHEKDDDDVDLELRLGHYRP